MAVEFAAAAREVSLAERALVHAQREESKFATLVGQSDTAISNLTRKIGSRGGANRADRAPLKVKLEQAQEVRNRRADELEAARSMVEASRANLDKATNYAEAVKAACVAAVLEAIDANPPEPITNAA
jgi:hypothetical protein